MRITYESSNIVRSKFTTKLDKTKKNILIIGRGSDESNRLEILNPQDEANAISLYGNSELYRAYLDTYRITRDNNIYTINCYYDSDFIEVIDYVMQYEFNYIVPTGINIRDEFYNPITKKMTYYFDHYLDVMSKCGSRSTFIFTDKHAELYEDIDHYVYEMRDIIYGVLLGKDMTLDTYGNNAIFVLNMIKDVEYSNTLVAAALSNVKQAEHPNDLYYPAYKTVYDIDYRDVDSKNIVFFKYNVIDQTVSIDNFYNLRKTNDEYKVVMIDETIKELLRRIDLEEYKGRLYKPYVKLSIESKLKKILDECEGKIIKSYKINSIRFVKTHKTSGYIYIELSVMPYGSLEYLKIVRVI